MINGIAVLYKTTHGTSGSLISNQIHCCSSWSASLSWPALFGARRLGGWPATNLPFACNHCASNGLVGSVHGMEVWLASPALGPACGRASRSPAWQRHSRRHGNTATGISIPSGAWGSSIILNQSDSNNYFGDHGFTPKVKVLPILFRRYSSMFVLEYQIISSVRICREDLYWT
jgi:hypothetical protein